jgi:hypothetical protein
LQEHALIDRALLKLMLGDEQQRPWAEDELLAHSAAGGGPLADAQVYEAFSTDRQRGITDALGRLDGDGLVERRGGFAIVSEVARSFDELMKL